MRIKEQETLLALYEHSDDDDDDDDDDDVSPLPITLSLLVFILYIDTASNDSSKHCRSGFKLVRFWNHPVVSSV